MTIATIQVPVSQEIYHRLESLAVRLEKPVETLLSETLQAILPVEDTIPLAIQQEVNGLTALRTDELQEVAISMMSDKDQEVFDQLLDMQKVRALTRREQTKLKKLRTEYGRVLVRKARAFALLAERGQPLQI